ncbi:MAG TPA: hypothetical protein VFZ21_23175 [Gemmatimonadaceae bacterium]|nr:hypothetical protein [Gemmatimonadaceae bacterium]
MLALSTACSDATAVGHDNIELVYDFSTGFQGWEPSFADYPVGKEAEWGLNASLATLPSPLETTRRAILLTGVNHSDDLFMFITRGVDDLVPNGRYALRFRVLLATNAPRGCFGVGGAPGEAVVLKVGASAQQPERLIDDAQYYRTNFDYGAQLEGGRDVSPVGNLANSNANCSSPRYELKEFDSGPTPLAYAADGNGRLWLIVGIDSGFEGTTAAYIAAVRVEIDPR